jgi:transketolase
MRAQFRTTVTELAAQDERIIVVLGDVSVYMFKDFWDRYPNRFYNMGICENTLISVSAGLSSQGYHPFVHTICPFLTERSVEQIKLDMCYNNFAGNIVTCGATFDYAWDGATHHAYTELAILRMLPTMEVLHLGSKREVDALIRTQYNNSRPTYFRLSDHPHAIETNLEFGKGTLLKNEGAPVTVMTAGPILGNVMEACRDLPVNLVYFHTLKPIDKALIEQFRDTEILVVHDAYGLHEAIAEVPALRMHYHGLPDEFCGWYGTVHDIRKRIGLDPAGIRAAAQALLARHARPSVRPLARTGSER